MSEQRFYITDTGLGLDTVSDEMYSFGDEEDFCRLFDKLNEQQSTIIELQERIIDLKDDKNQLHKVISKLRQEVAELKTRNSVLSSKLNQIPKNIREVWLE